jgi:hypothetical protein
MRREEIDKVLVSAVMRLLKNWILNAGVGDRNRYAPACFHTIKSE